MRDTSEANVLAKIARIHAKVLAAVLGLLCGVGVFVMTAWLVVQGGPNPGAHLQLLENYFIGYSVTWLGSLVGLGYGMIVGGLIGWSIGVIYNRIADA